MRAILCDNHDGREPGNLLVKCLWDTTGEYKNHSGTCDITYRHIQQT